MIVVGHIVDAWVEDGRVLAHGRITYETHNARVRFDMTPVLTEGLSMNLEQYAKSCIGNPIKIDNPNLLEDLDALGTDNLVSFGGP